MELTLKRLLEQAEFTETRKGYDRGEVDEFLDRAVAMATKVEAKLTETMGQAKASSTGSGSGGAANVGSSSADFEAEVERRVSARLGDAAPVATGPSEDEVADEVHRTIVLAQRTADAAVREAREDAAKLLAAANERAGSIQAESEAASAASRAKVTAEAEAERRTAREALDGEIAKLDGLRVSIRNDISLLERHVEEQRNQLHSTVGELQRLLDDPAGFRMAPTPATVDHDVPDLDLDPLPAAPSDASGPPDDATEGPGPSVVDAANTSVADVEIAASTDQPADDPAPDQPTDEPQGRDASSGEAQAPVGRREDPPVQDAPDQDAAVQDAPVQDGSGHQSDGQTTEIVDDRPGSPGSGLDEVDHAMPGVRGPVGSDPPTAPVSAVDLDMESTSATPAPPRRSGPAGDADRDEAEEDAFLAELRKAMADDEPLGPRDQQDQPAGELFDDDDRRGWRFGKRR